MEIDKSSSGAKTDENTSDSHKSDPLSGNASKIYTYKGARPFVGAVEYYENKLNRCLNGGKNFLSANPNCEYAKIKLKLFSRFYVECSNKEGSIMMKSYYLHEPHYGPIVRRKRTNVDIATQKWLDFFSRYNYIWVLINTDKTKLPGGDGTGMGDTACSAFRTAQLKMMQEGYYLIDVSHVVLNRHRRHNGFPSEIYLDYQNKYRYNIDIRLYRNIPMDGPFKSPFGYGYIPGLGPAKNKPIKRDVLPQAISTSPPEPVEPPK